MERSITGIPLIEQCLDYQFLTEEKNGKKYHIIEGIFLQAQIKNRNGRIYPIDVMDNEVNRYIREMVNDDRAVGELGHTEVPTINPERVSHKIISLIKEGNNYLGKARISNSPFGKIVQNFLEEDIKFGVSSRGAGSLKKQGDISYVQPDFYLATAADVVFDPSAPDAFVRGIMENKEYIVVDGLLQEAKIDQWKKEIKTASINNLREAEIHAYSEFLNELDNSFKFSF